MPTSSMGRLQAPLFGAQVPTSSAFLSRLGIAAPLHVKPKAQRLSRFLLMQTAHEFLGQPWAVTVIIALLLSLVLVKDRAASAPTFPLVFLRL